MILEAQVQLLVRGERGTELSMTSTMLSEMMMRRELSREYLCTEYRFTVDHMCVDFRRYISLLNIVTCSNVQL